MRALAALPGVRPGSRWRPRNAKADPDRKCSPHERKITQGPGSSALDCLRPWPASQIPAPRVSEASPQSLRNPAPIPRRGSSGPPGPQSLGEPAKPGLNNPPPPLRTERPAPARTPSRPPLGEPRVSPGHGSAPFRGPSSLASSTSSRAPCSSSKKPRLPASLALEANDERLLKHWKETLHGKH